MSTKMINIYYKVINTEFLLFIVMVLYISQGFLVYVRLLSTVGLVFDVNNILKKLVVIARFASDASL